jgi:SAM-dependent methyltransferase
MGSRGGCANQKTMSNATLEARYGSEFLKDIGGKTLIDFGCGYGHDAIALSLNGAVKVVGIDIREHVLEQARANAEKAGVADRCVFTTQTDIKADVIVSYDAFEHFQDPKYILELMNTLLAPGGVIWISFGPPWYHPRGGHLFSVFPWAHLIFSENALLRWRSEFKNDGATRICEVEGGLNRMSLRRFIRLINSGPLEVEALQFIPIRGCRALINPLTRELFTSVVRCRLRRSRV